LADWIFDHPELGNQEFQACYPQYNHWRRLDLPLNETLQG
jgi:metal-dependent amidase/aminoacylase/carboxypeptidase family protein